MALEQEYAERLIGQFNATKHDLKYGSNLTQKLQCVANFYAMIKQYENETGILQGIEGDKEVQTSLTNITKVLVNVTGNFTAGAKAGINTTDINQTW